MKPVLIDTDILSEFFRGNSLVVNAIKNYLEEYGTISLSIITYYEILNGLLYKDAKKQLMSFKEFVALNTVIPLLQPAAAIAAKIYADLRKTGNEIGHTDTLIAGIAIANDFVLISNNVTHFKRIEHLHVSTWLK